MLPQDVLEHLNAKPFRPFRIRMASGYTVEIRHPEMARVGMSYVVVFTYSSHSPQIHEKMEMLGLQLIESIEVLEAPVAQDQE